MMTNAENGLISVPQYVIDHCNKHKLCKGCQLNCTAPVSDRDFQPWLKTQVEKIRMIYDR